MKKQEKYNISANNFWNKLCQKKFDLIYYGEHFKSCINLNRIIRIIIAVGTIIASAVFMNWFDIKFIRTICMIVIVILQGCSCLLENLPYDKRKNELFSIEKEINNIYNDMENDWIKILKSEYTAEEIDNKLANYTKNCDKVYSYHFKDDALPRKEKFVEIAQKEMENYFSNFTRS